MGLLLILTLIRLVASNDGCSTDTCQSSVEFGILPSSSLPPSTCSTYSINVDRMESGYQFIAALISDFQ